jgi:drug/metabolite transporter (DMT)-like permease
MAVAPGPATVLLALGAALCWGFGDFGGGLSSRRAPVAGVVIVVLGVGGSLVLGLAVLLAAPLPSPATIGLAVTSGFVGAGAILAFYHALAVGRMSVVAPTAAVLGAVLPVVVGLVLLGPPSPVVMLGIGLGIVGVVLVSRVADPGGRPSGLAWAIGAGGLIGLFQVLVSRFPEGQVLWPLATLRVTATVLVVLFALTAGRPWRVPRAALPLAIAVGIADIAGNACYIAATQAGRLDVAAVVSSFFPIVTVILAVALLHERVTRSHAAGIAAAAVAVALIVSG